MLNCVSSKPGAGQISGYHMAVVAGVMFFAFRALFALMPAFSSRHPIKKCVTAVEMS